MSAALTSIQDTHDVQASPDLRRIPINKVGVKGIRHPVLVKDRSSGFQHTVADFNMYVSLPQDFKGTHMSRFVEILSGNEHALSVESFRGMLFEVASRLGAETGYIEMKFPYFVEKRAPVTGVASLMDYEVTFLGRVSDGVDSLSTRVLVPATSLCPCSKKISAYGAHNQRAHITLTVESRETIWIEELIDIAEQQASSQLYGVLKRPDEKFVTEQAYDNPKFVEDLARDVAQALNSDPRVISYTVEVENFESIHNHSAYALIEGPPKAEEEGEEPSRPGPTTQAPPGL
ncbi:MAG TPA: GTP cyclohydrolase FolE2 [Polyangiaceae bacterium]|jgi:GTP cyclohydrolase I|nr:GTP cyclohydrolase FolE2 [Polyangiaceae bacterium]